MAQANSLWRSQLGNAGDLAQDATDSGADAVSLDLEDSLAPGEKAPARAELAGIVEDHAWSEGLSYRINGTDTRWWYDDGIEVVTAVGETVDAFTVPRVRGPADVRTVATLLDSVERDAHLAAGSVGLAAQVETAEGGNAVTELCHASDRLTAVVFGPADYAAPIGAAHGASDCPGHYPLSRVSHAAASAGLRSPDSLDERRTQIGADSALAPLSRPRARTERLRGRRRGAGRGHLLFHRRRRGRPRGLGSPVGLLRLRRGRGRR